MVERESERARERERGREEPREALGRAARGEASQSASDPAKQPSHDAASRAAHDAAKQAEKQPAHDAAKQAASEPPAPPAVRFRRAFAITTARGRLPRLVIEQGGRGSYRLPVISYALEADDGWYLIDAGMRAVLAVVRRYLPWVAALGAARPLESGLAALGVRPDDVRAVYLTHLDYDHTGGLPGLSAAPAFVTRREHAHALAVLEGALANAFEPKRLWEWTVGRQRGDDVRAPRSLLPLDPPALPPGARGGELLRRGLPVVEGGALRVIDLPGHSAGHAGFHARLASGRELFFVGDAAFSEAALAGRAEPGLFPNAVAHDRARALDTLEALRALRRERPDLAILCAHDEALGERAAEGPVEV